MSAFATRFLVRWLCGSSSQAISVSLADDGAHAFEHVALAIVVALRDHRAMQPEHNAIDRQRGAQLIKDFVAQAFVGCALQEPARLGPGGAAFDQREALLARAAAQHNHRRRAERRRLGMVAWAGVKGRFETRPVGGDRRKRIGLGGQRER